MSALRDLIVDALKQADHLLLSLCVAANLFGIVLIYSATRWKAIYHSFAFKQAIAMCIGIVLYFVVSQFNIDVLKSKWKWVIVGCTVLILLLLTPLGKEVGGNRAWLHIRHFPFDLQPAEIGKIFFTILLAQLLAQLRQEKRINRVSSVALMCLLLGYFVGLLFLTSGDAGSCLVYVSIFVFMVWGAGLGKLWFAAGITCAGVGGYLLWTHLPERFSYMKDRIYACMDHDYDPQGAGFQQIRSMLAIRSGGLTGQGFLKGLRTQAPYASRLPERQTDFIFSSCCEEWGMVGGILVVFLLMAIILRCLYVGVTAPDPFSSLVCIGYSGMFIAQVWMNLGMCLFVMPVIGLTLPFFSYGGSSIITNYVIMGIISGVKNRSQPSWLKNSETPEREPARRSVLFVPESMYRR